MVSDSVVMANFKTAKSWEIVRQQFNCSRVPNKVLESVTISSDASVEFCVRLLRTSHLHNFAGLRTKLQTSSDQWISEFLAQGGMEILFQSLESLSLTGRVAFMEAYMQLECVNCIKAVLNSKQGLDLLVQSKSLACSLTKG